MSRFDQAFIRTVINHEGPYVNHPADRGGETFYGIARRYHSDWPGWPILDSYSLDVKQLLRIHHIDGGIMGDNVELTELTTSFYYDHFWRPLNLQAETIPQPLAEAVFDCAVAMGRSRGGLFLQHALNLINDARIAEDGAIGPKTLYAIEAADRRGVVSDVIRVMTVLRAIHYYDQVQRDASQQVFLRGWLRRLLP